MQTLTGNLFKAYLNNNSFPCFSSKKHEPYLYIDVNTLLPLDLPMYFTLNILTESFLTVKKSPFCHGINLFLNINKDIPYYC